MLEVGGRRERRIKGLFLLPPASSEAILKPLPHGSKARRTNVYTIRLFHPSPILQIFNLARFGLIVVFISVFLIKKCIDYVHG